jgi:hypothetical protein
VADRTTAPGSPRERLDELRRALLDVHRTLLDVQREAHERVHGRVSAGELLQLAIRHESFAWLHPLAELIVRIDDLLDGEPPATHSDVDWLVTEMRGLLRPSEAGTTFERQYAAAIQQSPAVVLAHGRVLLAAGRRDI